MYPSVAPALLIAHTVGRYAHSLAYAYKRECVRDKLQALYKLDPSVTVLQSNADICNITCMHHYQNIGNIHGLLRLLGDLMLMQ